MKKNLLLLATFMISIVAFGQSNKDAKRQKFVNELEKIKAAHAKLAEMLDSQISEVEGKVASETEKVKEMMGLIEKAKKPAVKKAAKKDDKKEEPKEEKPKADDKKKVKK